MIQSHRKGINPDLPLSLQKYNELTVDNIKRKIVNKSNFVMRYINDVFYAIQCFKYWIKIKNVDIIYLQSNPTITLSMILLKILKRKPIIYVIYDVFPGHAYDVGVVKSKFLYRIMQFVQKPCYKLATRIVVLEKDMKEKIVEQGAKPDIVRIIPAWYDITNTREIPIDTNRFIQKYNINKNKFYVQFAGSIGFIFRYEVFIELATRLKNYSDIIIQIVGDGPLKDKFISLAKELELNNIEFYPLQPVEIVSDVYSACNVCLIPLKKGVIGNGIPSKVAILMACRRVIVNCVESSSYYSKMFTDNAIGISVDIDDMTGLTDAIIDLYRNPQKAEFFANNAQRFGKEHYSSVQSIQKFITIFREVLS